MRCEVDYCIYNRAWECILEDIQINALGMCDDCILLSLEEDFLKEAKRTQLESIELRWSAGEER